MSDIDTVVGEAVIRFRDSMTEQIAALAGKQMPVAQFERAANRAAVRAIGKMIGQPVVFFVPKTVDGEKRMELRVELPMWMTVLFEAQYTHHAANRKPEGDEG